MLYKLPKRKPRMSEEDKLIIVFGCALMIIKLALVVVITGG